MSKVIVTGASGFVGQNLTRYLKSNFFLSTLSLRSGLHLAEVFDEVNSIVHLAGKAHDLKKTSSPEEYYQINFELTQRLYDAFLVSDATKFIFISSVKATADQTKDILTEEHISNPQTHYGKSKRMAEEYILNQPLPAGKSYYILRPCMIHGPGNKGNLNLLYKFASKGLPYPLAAFHNKRSFLSVENLCYVIKELLQRNDVPSGIYNVADDDALSTIEIVTLLAQAQKKAPRLLNIPKNLIRFVAKVGDNLRLPLTTERLRKLTENFIVSNQKIKDALKKELPLSAREGILRTARSFKEP